MNRRTFLKGDLAAGGLIATSALPSLGAENFLFHGPRFFSRNVSGWFRVVAWNIGRFAGNKIW